MSSQPNSQLTLEALHRAVCGSAAAFRSRTVLQPGGGDGDKVFPPTYEGGRYATESRRIPGSGEVVECVVLDAVPAQANRMEEALQQALDEERLCIPVVEVDFTDKDLISPVGKITSLQAPHRIADAILRDSLLDGTPFRKSGVGQRLDGVSLANATVLYEMCPTALIFGLWDSTGPKGGLGAKFQRAIVSEIVGIGVIRGVKTSSRIDPLQIARKAGPLYRKTDGGWTLDPVEAMNELKGGKPTGKKVLYKKNARGKDVFYDPTVDADKLPEEGRPSEANHGNIPPSVSDASGGVTVSSVEQTITISLPALRRLRFPLNGGQSSREVNEAGRVALSALSLCAAVLAAEKGFDLRSRCLLWPTEPIKWELLDTPGEECATFDIDAESAIQLLNQAVTAAEAVGLEWKREPLKLDPSPELVALVRKSQELSAAQGGDPEGGE